MKSRIHNNTEGAKDMGTYLELPLRQFINQMPQYADMILQTPVDLNDTNYIVRFCIQKSGSVRFEVGYPEDVEWRIGKPDKSKEPSYPSRNKELEELLDAEISNGKKYVILSVRDYLEKLPQEERDFMDFLRYKDNAAVCLFRDQKTNDVVTVVGDRRNSRDDWENIIERNMNDYNIEKDV